MEETKPSAPSLYTKIGSLSEKYTYDKILSYKKFNYNIIIKDMKNYYET